MGLKLQPATSEDAESIAALRNAVSDDLTFKHGRGWWTAHATTEGALYDLRTGLVFVVLRRGEVIATLKLAVKKPWSIDPKLLGPAKNPYYLTSMAIAPDLQRQGIGRACLAEAERIARRGKADAILLDAYDHPTAGAGPFYAKCGYRETGRAKYRDVPLIYYERKLTPPRVRGG